MRTTVFPNEVAEPVKVTRHRASPWRHRPPAKAVDPGETRTVPDSPVIADISTSSEPSRSRTSAPTASPARSLTTSPGTSSREGTDVQAWSRNVRTRVATCILSALTATSAPCCWKIPITAFIKRRAIISPMFSYECRAPVITAQASRSQGMGPLKRSTKDQKRLRFRSATSLSSCNHSS